MTLAPPPSTSVVVTDAAPPSERGRVPGAHHWVIGCSAVALAPMVVVHLAGAEVIDPIDQPISHYVFVATGYEMILLGSVLLATAAIAIAYSMARSARSLRGPAALLISFAFAMLLVGLFPTDRPDTVALSASATLHRWSAAYAFAVLPVIGLLSCRSTAIAAVHRARLWGLSLAVCIGTGLVFAIHLPMAVVGSHIPMFGLIERLGFVVMVTFMVVLSGTLRPVPGPAPVAVS